MAKKRTRSKAARSRLITDELGHLVGLETYRVGSPEEHVRWLLGFLRTDIQELTPGELLDLRMEAARFVLGARLGQRLDGDPRWPVEDAAVSILHRLQSKLLKGFERLSSGRAWEPFGKKPPNWMILPHPDGYIQRRDIADLETTFVLYATDVMIQFWPRLRRCEHEPCGVLFLPEHGRQRYHEPGCSTKARQQRHAPRRKRDYQREHLQRAKKEHGPNVKPRSRKKKASTKAGKR